MPRGPERGSHYLVVDLEATCADDGSIPWPENEIIEIGVVMVGGDSLEPVDELQSFVRPVRRPQLTAFCRDLTHIAQEDVDRAPVFAEVLPAVARWARRYTHPLLSSWGEFDRKLLALECRRHNLPYPFGGQHLDVKARFQRARGLDKPPSLKEALALSGLEHRGTWHRGIDDARNIARLLPLLLARD